MNAPATAGRVLVFGASGYIGTNLVPRLIAEGVPLRGARVDMGAARIAS